MSRTNTQRTSGEKMTSSLNHQLRGTLDAYFRWHQDSDCGKVKGSCTRCTWGGLDIHQMYCTFQLQLPLLLLTIILHAGAKLMHKALFIRAVSPCRELWRTRRKADFSIFVRRVILPIAAECLLSELRRRIHLVNSQYRIDFVTSWATRQWLLRSLRRRIQRWIRLFFFSRIPLTMLHCTVVNFRRDINYGYLESGTRRFRGLDLE